MGNLCMKTDGKNQWLVSKIGQMELP